MNTKTEDLPNYCRDNNNVDVAEYIEDSKVIEGVIEAEDPHSINVQTKLGE